MVKTSDQTSFSSVSFRRSLLLSLPEHQISAQCQACTYSQLLVVEQQKMSSLYRKAVGATQEKKVKQATKSKTNRLASNAFLGPSKRRKRRVCRDPTPSDTPSDSVTDLAVPFDDDSTEKEQDADCVYCTGRFSKDHKGEEWIRCAKYFRWAYTLCAGMEEDFICEPYQG
jgi:hypothetical protein